MKKATKDRIKRLEKTVHTLVYLAATQKYLNARNSELLGDPEFSEKNEDYYSEIEAFGQDLGNSPLPKHILNQINQLPYGGK